MWNPKTEAERDLWVKACIAKPGETVEGLTKSQKQRIRSRCYVVEGQLMDRSLHDEKLVEKPVLVDSDFERLWQKHHDQKNHPGRDITVTNIETEVAQVSHAMVKKALVCQICRQKATAKLVALN